MMLAWEGGRSAARDNERGLPMGLRGKYAIVGVGYTPQGRLPDRTTFSFHLEAVANAIADAGLKKDAIDGLIAYRHFPACPGEPDVTPQLIAQGLGLTPDYLCQDANCSRSHLQQAIGAIEAGFCNYVAISYGHSGLSGGGMHLLLEEMAGNEVVFGHFGAAGGYALAARRGMHEFSAGPETWKHIAMGQRKWADRNPAAIMRGKPMTEADYYGAPMVVDPLRLFDCCLVNDGGRAIIVTTAERARDLKQPPVLILGLGQHNPSTEIGQSRYMAGPTGSKKAGEAALRMAGVGLADVDACQIYDCFSYTVELTLQDYGFFGRGEGKDWFQGGTIEPGGRLPINTSGGQLSEAYFMGLTPISEAVMQLMGRCEDRQLGPKTNTKTPEIIMCSDNGAILQSQSCFIFGRG